MKDWSKYPFLKIAIPFVIGIIIYFFANINSKYILLCLTPLPFLIFFYILNILNAKYSNRYVFGVLLNIQFVFFGILICDLNKEINYKTHFSKIKGAEMVYSAKIIEPPIERKNSYKILCEIDEVLNDTIVSNTKGKALIYLEKDSTSSKLNYGNRLIFNRLLSEVDKPANPYEFDYKNYLANKQVYYQLFLPINSYKPVFCNDGNLLLKTSYKIRDFVLQVFKNNGIAGDEFSVASALVIGYDELLSIDQRKAYSGSGVMHVLCVSGLHVGIIYALTSILLFFLPRNRWSKILKATITILIIWMYAFITGFSPSVQRAAFMFSFVAFGNAINRKVYIYNSIAASAFIILLIAPFTLFHVGFQLSYLAVIGIVTIKPLFDKLYLPKYQVVRYLWEIITVSIAAQIATFPLTILYFHQFPNYFILSNIVILPFIAILLYTGISLVIFFKIGFIAKIFAKALTMQIWALNQFVKWVESMPGAVTNNINVSPFITFLIFTLIIAAYMRISEQKTKATYLILTACLLIIVSVKYQNFTSVNQEKIIIHSINKHSVINYINGLNCITLIDSSLNNNREKINFFTENLFVKSNINKKSVLLINDNNDSVVKSYRNFILINNKRILVLDNNFKINNINNIKLDYVLLTNNAKHTLAKISKNFVGAVFIADKSNTRYRVDKWEQEAHKHSIKFVNIYKSGAYEIIF